MRLSNFFSAKTEYVKVEDKNRFYYMLQQMQSNRWKITAIVLGLFFFIILGINAGVFLGATINEDWKEMLLILLGAFVGNLNKVVDYWFNSEDRDKMLIQKVDEEDGVTLSNVGEYPEAKKKETEMPDYTKRNNTTSNVTVTPEPVSEEVSEYTETVVEETTFEKVEVDEDGDGVNDGYDTDGDGDVDEYFEHRNCEHVWGDADGDGYEECQICGLLRSQTEE
jgi:uncharacterized membrane protein (DUF485 family)